MWTKREHLIFWAGATAFHAFSHLTIQFAHVLPMRFWGINLTPQFNMYVTIILVLITVGLLWWAKRSK